MRFLRFGSKGQEKPGCLDSSGQLRDLSGVAADFTGEAVSLKALAKLRALDLSALPVVPAGVRLGSCLGDIPDFLCIGLNYARHAAETGADIPKEPIIFSKASSALSGPFDPVVLPKGSLKGDWEAELGVIIGREASYVSEADALSYVAGYCTLNDVSEREYQKDRGGQWIKGKSAPTFGPIGPYLVTADEVEDPQNLSVRMRLNGELRQDSSTSDMIFPVAEIISYLSQFMLLRVGTVIATGTPEGVGAGAKPQRFLKPGDVMEAEIGHLGAQRLDVVAHGTA